MSAVKQTLNEVNNPSCIHPAAFKKPVEVFLNGDEELDNWVAENYGSDWDWSYSKDETCDAYEEVEGAVVKDIYGEEESGYAKFYVFEKKNSWYYNEKLEEGGEEEVCKKEEELEPYFIHEDYLDDWVSHKYGRNWDWSLYKEEEHYELCEGVVVEGKFGSKHQFYVYDILKQNEVEENNRKEKEKGWGDNRVYRLKYVLNAKNKGEYIDKLKSKKNCDIEEYVEDITEGLTEEEVCEKMNGWISHYLKLKHKQSSKDIMDKVGKIKSRKFLSPDKEDDLYKTMFKVSDNFDRSSLINHLTEFINTYTF